MSDSNNLIGSSGLIPEKVLKATFKTPKPGGAGLGEYHYAYVLVGASGGDVVLKVTGFDFSTPTPWTVLCQPRQSDNLDHGWPDQFCVQVIETARDFVRIRIRRVDANGAGWGQNLRIDMLIIE